jgi:hypothetical protein
LDKRKQKNSWLLWLKPIILATWEVEIGRIMIQGQPRQKVSKTPSQPMTGYGGTCLSFQLCWKAQVGRSWFQADPGTKQEPISKIINAKKGLVEQQSAKAPA